MSSDHKTTLGSTGNPPTSPAALAKDLFLRWLDRESGESDAALEQDLAAAAEAVQVQVHALLAAHRRAQGLLVETRSSHLPSDAQSAKSEITSAIAQESIAISGYEIGRELGRGGFGVVYEARQISPVQRMVAIKVLRSEFASADVVRRFQAEARVLARLDHPGIARVTDAGTDAAGRPFVAMELVDGRPLLEYCRQKQLNVRERVALMAELCRAVHHAHQRAVIHRDLKPLNVLVETREGIARPRVIDFGVAKLLDDAMPDTVTRAGARIGTPRYMSPEQARSTDLHDIRIDVYALGVMLCEVLSGSHPRAPKPGELAPSDDSIHSRAATKPSSLIEQCSDEGPVHSGDVRGDLDRIVLKAIALDPDDRYSSAAAMAQDLDRYLAGQPVLATQGGTLYVLRKLVLRHRVASLAIAFAVISLLGGTIASLLALNRAEIARADAERDRLRAEAVSAFLLGGMLDASNPDLTGGREYSLVAHLRQASTDVSKRFADDPHLQLRVLDRIGQSQRSLTDFSSAAVTFAKAADVSSALFGPDSKQTIGHQLEAMLATLSTGKTDGQADIALHVRDTAVRTLGQDDPLSLRATLHAAHIAPSEDGFEDLERVKRRLEDLGMTKSELYLEALTLIGRLATAERSGESTAVLEQASSLANELFGPTHSRAIESRHNLASFLIGQGHYDEADRILLEVSATATQAHGDLSLFNSLALRQRIKIAMAQNRLEDALAMARHVLDIVKRSNAPTSDTSVQAHHAVGVTLLELHRYEEAIEHLSECRALRRKLVEPTHHNIVYDGIFLSSALAGAGRQDEAAAMLPDVRSRLPRGSVVRARGIVTEAQIAMARGKSDEAHAIVDAELADIASLRESTAQSRIASDILSRWKSTQR